MVNTFNAADHNRGKKQRYPFLAVYLFPISASCLGIFRDRSGNVENPPDKGNIRRYGNSVFPDTTGDIYSYALLPVDLKLLLNPPFPRRVFLVQFLIKYLFTPQNNPQSLSPQYS